MRLNQLKPNYHIAFRVKMPGAPWKHMQRDFVFEHEARAQCQKIHDRLLDWNGDSATEVVLINLNTNEREVVEYDGGVSYA